MSKLEMMSLSEIISKTGLCLTTDCLYDIWKKDAAPEKNIFNPEGISVTEELRDREHMDDMLASKTGEKLSRFLLAHEAEMDKIKLVLNILKAYKEALATGKLTPEIRKKYENGLVASKSLLREIDKTYLYYVQNDVTGRMDSITIVNTQEEVREEKRNRKPKNTERVAQLERQWDFADLISSVPTNALEQIFIYPEDIGREISAIIEYNVALEELNGNVQTLLKICEDNQFESYIRLLEQEKFAPEMARILRQHIDAVDIDKLLLCAGVVYIKEIEDGKIPKEDIPKIYQKLQVINSNIKKNTELQILDANEEQSAYESKTFSKEMLRFIPTDEGVRYLTIQECSDLKQAIANGTFSMNSLSQKEFEALLFNTQEINSILKLFPNNYVFFLRQGHLIHSKEVILKNIISSGECSQELLKLLCEQTNITHEEIQHLFDMEIISTSDMESVKDIKEHLISDTKLFEKYTEFKIAKDEDKEKARIQLERYALAYRKIELLGKNNEEAEQRGEEFIESVGDKIQPEDLIHLYGLDIIPLKVAVEWGGEDIINQLLQTERLKPADARYLRDKGLLDEHVLARLFENNDNMSYAYQVSLVCTVFDGQTAEEQEIKQRLAQYYHIEKGLINSGNKGTGLIRGMSIGQINGVQQKVKMRDPGAKYNLLSAIDQGTKIEEGIVDGHIIFHYPNIDGGTVLIEKLHKITTDRSTGFREIKADNSAATYIISEDDFIKIKSALVQSGKVDRTQLTQRWHRVPGHWVAHIGKDSWERGIKDRFCINPANSRYSDPKDLEKMEKLLLESAQSKDIEDR